MMRPHNPTQTSRLAVVMSARNLRRQMTGFVTATHSTNNNLTELFQFTPSDDCATTIPLPPAPPSQYSDIPLRSRSSGSLAVTQRHVTIMTSVRPYLAKYIILIFVRHYIIVYTALFYLPFRRFVFSLCMYYIHSHPLLLYASSQRS